MMAQAAKIKETTGKPYFTMGTLASGDAGNGARGYYTLLYTQGGNLFANGPDKPDFKTPEVTARPSSSSRRSPRRARSPRASTAPPRSARSSTATPP